MSLFTDVRTRLNEASAVFWPDAQVYDALNEALLEIYARVKFTYAIGTMTLATNDTVVALPTSVFIPQRIISNTIGEKPITTRARMERYNRGWQNHSAAEPTHFIEDDQEHVRAFPKSNGSYTYTVTGVAYPTAEISSGNLDLTGVPKLIRHAIEFTACAILIQATLPFVADEWFKQAEVHIYDYLEQKRNNQSHNTRRLRPAAKWQHILGGDIDMYGRI